MQLDLFEHSGNVGLQIDVVTALNRRNADACAKAIATLEARNSADHLLPAFKILCETLHSPLPDPLDPGRACAILEHYRGDVADAASGVFGNDAQAWLTPLWRDLANTFAAYPFDPAWPELHTAPMLLRAGCWKEAEASISGIVDWQREPAPLAWMIEAKLRINDINTIWTLLAELAWMAPKTAQDLVARLAQPELDRLVDRFSVEFDGDGTQDDFAWFPAWALVAVPGLAQVLRDANNSTDTPAANCARIVLELRKLEREGSAVTEGRKKLKEANPALFALYLRNLLGRGSVSD